MTDLKSATIEDIEAELARRKAPAPERIKPLENPDLSQLLKTCEYHVDEIMRGEDEDSDSPHYIYEAALEALYGKGFWQWHKQFPS